MAGILQEFDDFLDNEIYFVGVLIIGIWLFIKHTSNFYGWLNDLIQGTNTSAILAVAIIALIVLFGLSYKFHKRINSLEDKIK